MSADTIVWCLVASSFALLGNSATQTREAPTLQVTLLGTGNPRPSLERFGPSTLVEAGATQLLIDAGRGAVQRLFQLAGVRALRSLDMILFTHLHSDHVVGFSDLWLTSWVFGRDHPWTVIGPPGTREMCGHLEEAFAFDKKVRSQDQGDSPEGIKLVPRDVDPGVVFDEDGLKVTAFVVDHGRQITPAYGYRVDYRGLSAAFSGDTRYFEPIVDAARGVDVLVHEVISPEVEARRAGTTSIERTIAHHTSPEQAGQIFARVKPRLAVYSHIVPSPTTPEDLIPATRRTYDGPLAVGYDLMTIRIGPTTIDVYPRQTVSDK